MKKSPIHERKMIVTRPEKRPYGVRVQFHIKTLGDIGGLENVCIILDSGGYLILRPGEIAPWEGGQRMIIELEGFSTAAAAELFGKRLVQALLWTAIHNKRPLQLQYLSYEPAYIFERNRSSGSSLSAYGEVTLPPTKIINSLHDNYLFLPEPEPNLLLSMEIFAGAKLETSERATYLAMVSALEPMAQVKPLGATVDQLVDNVLNLLDDADEIPLAIRNSLSGRIGQLRNESIRQALKRIVKEFIPEIANASAIIDEAYSIRSQIVHNGRPGDSDIDFNEKSQELQNILISIYEKKMTLTR